MGTQDMVVFCVVLACSVYAFWVLMPSALRRLLAACLLRLPLGSVLRAALQRAAAPDSGCDCSGCDKVVDLRSTTNGARRVIRLHARPRD